MSCFLKTFYKIGLELHVMEGLYITNMDKKLFVQHICVHILIVPNFRHQANNFQD
jgi:hypothetical protein